jgi:hypothetical protein
MEQHAGLIRLTNATTPSMNNQLGNASSETNASLRDQPANIFMMMTYKKRSRWAA